MSGPEQIPTNTCIPLDSQKCAEHGKAQAHRLFSQASVV